MCVMNILQAHFAIPLLKYPSQKITGMGKSLIFAKIYCRKDTGRKLFLVLSRFFYLACSWYAPSCALRDTVDTNRNYGKTIFADALNK